MNLGVKDSSKLVHVFYDSFNLDNLQKGLFLSPTSSSGHLPPVYNFLCTPISLLILILPNISSF